MNAKIIYVLEKETKDGSKYYKNCLLIDGKFGFDLAVATSNTNYSDYVGTDKTVRVFWSKDHYCIQA